MCSALSILHAAQLRLTLSAADDSEEGLDERVVEAALPGGRLGAARRLHLRVDAVQVVVREAAKLRFDRSVHRRRQYTRVEPPKLGLWTAVQ